MKHTWENIALDTDDMGPFYLCKESQGNFQQACAGTLQIQNTDFSHILGNRLKSECSKILFYEETRIYFFWKDQQEGLFGISAILFESRNEAHLWLGQRFSVATALFNVVAAEHMKCG